MTMGDFMTTYRKDYVKKQLFTCYGRNLEGTYKSASSTIWFVEPLKHKSDYPNIISGPYIEHILPMFKTPEGYINETAIQCFERMRGTYPKIDRYLDKEIDEKQIKPEYDNTGRTVYQVEICKDDRSFISKATLARQRQPLPSDWGETPLTTQRSSYRDFKKKFNCSLTPKPCAPPEPNLKPNQKEREILKVTTGESEYGYNIGRLGNMIIDESLHGEIKESDSCKIWEKIQLEHAGEPYKIVPPYPVLTI